MDRNTVSLISDLANLRFKSRELVNFHHDFGSILSFLKQIQEVDTSSTAPLLHPLSLMNQIREDIIEVSNTTEQMVEDGSATKIESGFFVVPRILDEQ